MYAVIRTGGKQYKVSAGDTIAIEKLVAEVGDKVAFDIIFVCDGSTIITDADTLAKAEVIGEVVEHFKGEKAIIFKFKKRKNYKRTKGHRQQLTRVLITEISAPGCETEKFEKKVKAPKVEVEEVVEDVEVDAEVEAPVEAVEVVEEVAAEAEAEDAEAAEAEIDLAKMTVAQLKEFAAEKEIDIKGITKKAEIIDAITAAL
ncbi:MAG: 50S ribosomal protein L21 [bacterium]|nr:50S ribosomal protein L21 [bacterium]